MLNSRNYAVLTAMLSAAGLLPMSAMADISFIEGGEQLINTLHTHLYSSFSSLSSSDEFKISSVCFISDTSACSDNLFGGAEDTDYDLDDRERCFKEGYTISECPEWYEPGGKKCPYGDYYTECVSVCPSDYVTCEEPYHGVGEACNGKYASCTCTPCGDGYDYTTIPSGYIQDGEACLDCDKQTKYKIKINPCDGFYDCGSLGGEAGAATCQSGNTIKYDNCKPCPNLGTYTNCPIGSVCEYEDCSGLWYVTDCLSGYQLDSTKTKCTCFDGFELIEGKGCVEITDCRVGSILFSDMSCSMSDSNILSGSKTPIAVVTYKNGNSAQALALNSLEKTYIWGGYSDTSLPNLSNSEAGDDYASYENNSVLRQLGSSRTFPAIWAAYNYTTEGTKVGDWCLPAAGIFRSYHDNKNIINAGFEKAGGTPFTSNTYAWSSSEEDGYYAWFSSMNNAYGVSTSYYKNKSIIEVRPAIGIHILNNEICLNTYQYTCDGINETGGNGTTCGEKYASCFCKDGFIWKEGTCRPNWGTCTGLAANCALGDILFSDGTCSADVVDDKTPIAIVVYKSDNGNCGQAMTPKHVGLDTWYDSRYGGDVSEFKKYNSALNASQDYASCENSKIITAAGNYNVFPAAWIANYYMTQGTFEGDWCLPAAGIFTSIYNNQNVINSGFSRIGGVEFSRTYHAWSSTLYNDEKVWYSWLSKKYGIGNQYIQSYANYVRPVIEF